LNEASSSFSVSDSHFLLSCIMNSLNSLHSMSIRHFDIRPANIFKCENGDYILHDIQFMGGINHYAQLLLGGTRRDKKLSQKEVERKSKENKMNGIGEECYLAPEIFNELYNKTLDPGFNEKSEVFSIGMTILRTIVGNEVINCYNWDEYKFIPTYLTTLLASLPASFSFSPQPLSSSISSSPTFLELLKGMLAVNPSDRLTLSQLTQKLKLYDQSIQELEDQTIITPSNILQESNKINKPPLTKPDKINCEKSNEEIREDVKKLFKEFSLANEEARKEEGRHYSKEVLAVRKALMEDDYLECSLRREEVLRRSLMGREERGRRKRKDEDIIGGKEIYEMYLEEYEIMKSQVQRR
jgi:serine/threonine protein kinase